MALLNYSTTKNAEESISEIQKILSKHNVSAMTTEYEGRNVSSVAFRMEIQSKQLTFRMPCNWRAVQVVLSTYNENRRKINGRWQDKIKTDDETSIKVAWRVLKDWVEAQLALVEINMVTLPQVFLPFAVMKDGRTLAEHVEANPGFLLGNGE